MIRITGIRELSVPLQGEITNAVVNFASHDVSLVAVVSNVKHSGKPVIGFGFNSIGRFAQSGILRHRINPRVMAAEPASLLDKNEAFLSPAAVSQTAMKNEKPGGHGDRAGALGALELAIWDLNAKLAGKPAWSWIASVTGTEVKKPTIPTYAAGGYYYERDSLARLKAELRSYQDMGFDKFKIKGSSD